MPPLTSTEGYWYQHRVGYTSLYILLSCCSSKIFNTQRVSCARQFLVLLGQVQLKCYIVGFGPYSAEAEQCNLSGLHSSCKTVICSGQSEHVPVTQPPVSVWGIVHSAGG